MLQRLMRTSQLYALLPIRPSTRGGFSVPLDYDKPVDRTSVAADGRAETQHPCKSALSPPPENHYDPPLIEKIEDAC